MTTCTLSEYLHIGHGGALYDTRRPNWPAVPVRAIYQGAQSCTIGNTLELRAALRQPYAWPGGYELFAITSDGGCLCFDCVRAAYRSVSYSMRAGINDGWRVMAIEGAGNCDGPIDCEHCGREIVGAGE